MKSKELIKNGNELYPVLSTGIRVKLDLADVKSESFLTDIPFVPRKGDLIDAENMIDEKNYTSEELDKIYSLAWSVWYVNWGKDKDGYFAEIVCQGV